MKAVILAGGEGMRLRPITARRPKPMVKILDKTVLERTVELLKRTGVTEICMTLGYLPETIRASFGDGSSHGVQIETRVETHPLGTAGAVKACADFIGDEDFLVLSGDAVCNFDLKAVVAAHKAANAQASLVLYSHNRPVEYGLVVTESDGRIRRFVEKPGWEGVCTDLVNTGIYVCAPKILQRIPEDGPSDFARDIFPKMLEDGVPLYGFQAQGYWCDIGCPEEYLRCNMDVLAGLQGLEPDEQKRSAGVWAGSDLHGAEIKPPVYVGRDVFISRGAKLGPGAVICAGSSVGAGARVCQSVIDGAAVRDGADVSGAIVCSGASIGEGTRVEPGCVIGENTQVGKRSLVAGHARLWPDLELESGAKIVHDIQNGMLHGTVTFTEPSAMSGAFGTVLAPEAFLRMGTAAAAFGPVLLAGAGGEASAVLRSAFSSGVRAGGGKVILTDCGCAASLCYAVRALDGALGLWVQQNGGDIHTHFFAANGEELTRQQERKLETGAVSGTPRPDGRLAGTETYAAGLDMLYAAAVCTCLDGGTKPSASVFGSGAENRILRRALEHAGAYSCTADVRFTVLESGRSLQAITETGAVLSPQRLLACMLLAEFDAGVRTAAVPAMVPAVLNRIVDAYGGKLLRPGEKEYADLRLTQPWYFDGIFMAARLCKHLSTGNTLAEYDKRIPAFDTVRHEVRLSGTERGQVMRVLSASDGRLKEAPDGSLTAVTDHGYVRVEPSRTARALIFYGESTDAEMAAELCAPFERQARAIDSDMRQESL